MLRDGFTLRDTFGRADQAVPELGASSYKRLRSADHTTNQSAGRLNANLTQACLVVHTAGAWLTVRGQCLLLSSVLSLMPSSITFSAAASQECFGHYTSLSSLPCMSAALPS